MAEPLARGREPRAARAGRGPRSPTALILVALLCAAPGDAGDAELVAQLLAARAAPRAIAPPSELDVERGYAIQREITRRLLASGARVSGYKAGFTSAGAQKAFGIANPVYAPLFEDMRVEPGGSIRAGEYAALRAEVEVAFRLSAGLEPGFDAAALRRAVGSVHVALDLADLRLEGRPSAGALIADGVGARHYALGPPHAASDLHPAPITCELEVDAAVFTRAPSSDALGDPWQALAWLAAEHLRRGGRFEAGQVILTGALGRIYAPTGAPPRALAGRCERLGEVRVSVAP